MDVFSNLSKEEIEQLNEAPALITILIGASDGILDGEERTWSENLLRAKGFAGDKILQDYYRYVAEGFWVALHHHFAVLPTTVPERNAIIIERLENLNPVLAKLDPKVAQSLHKGYLGLAEEVAKASGGFLRIGGISAEEQEMLKLPMIRLTVDG
jgi:hypothetical protein